LICDARIALFTLLREARTTKVEPAQSRDARKNNVPMSDLRCGKPQPRQKNSGQARPTIRQSEGGHKERERRRTQKTRKGS
jgi:hypothetical protein